MTNAAYQVEIFEDTVVGDPPIGIDYQEGRFNSGVDCVEDFWGTRAPCKLYFRLWKPKQEPRGIVGIIHGLGEHCGRYGYVAAHFVSAGYAVCGFDFRGHGHSSGRKGHVESWVDFREDIKSFIGQLKTVDSQAPIFLFCHSLGALAGVDYLLNLQTPSVEPRIRGVITSSPPFVPANLSWFKLALSRILGRAPLLRRVHFTNGIDSKSLARDANEVRRYENDRLIHHLATPALAFEYEATRARTVVNAGDLGIPILMFSASGDILTPPRGTVEFYDRLPEDLDRESILIDDAFHEIHNDLKESRDTMLNHWLAWMDKRL